MNLFNDSFLDIGDGDIPLSDLVIATAYTKSVSLGAIVCFLKKEKEKEGKAQMGSKCDLPDCMIHEHRHGGWSERRNNGMRNGDEVERQ